MTKFLVFKCTHRHSDYFVVNFLLLIKIFLKVKVRWENVVYVFIKFFFQLSIIMIYNILKML